MNAMICAPDSVSEYVDVVVGVLYFNTLSPYMYILWTSVDLINPKKGRSRQYPAETKTNANDEDDLELLTNSPAQPECLQNSQEQAARNIGLNVKANRTRVSNKKDPCSL